MEGGVKGICVVGVERGKRWTQVEFGIIRRVQIWILDRLYQGSVFILKIMGVVDMIQVEGVIRLDLCFEEKLCKFFSFFFYIG